MFYLNSTLNFGIPPVLIFQLEIYYKLDRLTGLTAQLKGTPAQWYSNKTSLLYFNNFFWPWHFNDFTTRTHSITKMVKWICKIHISVNIENQ